MPDFTPWLDLEGVWQMGLLFLCACAVMLLTKFKPPRKDD